MIGENVLSYSSFGNVGCVCRNIAGIKLMLSRAPGSGNRFFSVQNCSCILWIVVSNQRSFVAPIAAWKHSNGCILRKSYWVGAMRIGAVVVEAMVVGAVGAGAKRGRTWGDRSCLFGWSSIRFPTQLHPIMTFTFINSYFYCFLDLHTGTFTYFATYGELWW